MDRLVNIFNDAQDWHWKLDIPKEDPVGVKV